MSAVGGGHGRGRRTALALALLALTALATVALVRSWRADADPRAALAAGDYRGALAALARAAESGDPEMLTALGNLHYLGLGTRRDARRAAELYHLAAKGGHAPAQVNLANLYRQGLGVAKDPLRAFGWYRQADIHGSPAAEYYLYQISVEYTLTPLQQATAAARWNRLDAIAAEAL